MLKSFQISLVNKQESGISFFLINSGSENILDIFLPAFFWGGLFKVF